MIVQIRNYPEPLYFAVSPLKRYFAILEKEWYGANKEIISPASNNASFNYKDENFSITNNEMTKQPFVSSNSVGTDFQKRCSTFSVLIKPIDSKPNIPGYYPEDIQGILESFGDDLREKYPRALRPKRA